MAEQKKPAAKKASAPTGTAKPRKAAVAITAKKTVARKSSAATVEPEKAKAPAVKAVSPARRDAASAAGKKSPAGKSVAAKAGPSPTPEEHQCMIQMAAYFIAERNGFQGSPADHWLQAELEIAAQLGS